MITVVVASFVRKGVVVSFVLTSVGPCVPLKEVVFAVVLEAV